MLPLEPVAGKWLLIRRRRGASTKMPEREKTDAVICNACEWFGDEEATHSKSRWLKKWSFGFKAPRSFGWIWLCLRVPFCTKLTTAPDKFGFGLLEAFDSTFPTEVLLRVTLPGRTIIFSNGLHKTKNLSQFACCVRCDGALNPGAIDGWLPLGSLELMISHLFRPGLAVWILNSCQDWLVGTDTNPSQRLASHKSRIDVQ